MQIEKALDRDHAVLRYVLERHAKLTPQAPFVDFWQGEKWTYAETLQAVRERATTLHKHGVRRGDHVLCYMRNGPDLLATWFAINYLGAIYVPINVSVRGNPLAHILSDAGAAIMVAEARFLDNLREVPPGALKEVIVCGESGRGAPEAIERIRLHSLPQEERVDSAALNLDVPINSWDTYAIMYTSGTTGNAKGVVSSYTQIYTMGPDAFPVADDDRCMICGPIFHVGSTLFVYAMLARGGSIGMMTEFKTQHFWDAVRDTGSTFVLLLGVMSSFLLKQPASTDDTRHPLRRAFLCPFTAESVVFSKRFNVEPWAIYNMTEISTPLHAGPDIVAENVAGTPRPWYELRIVDENDMERPHGEIGELVVRSHRPWALLKGYHNNPDATMKALRNGWFHTGDIFRIDEDGRYIFVDRLKDVIRRRGENISSLMLETEILLDSRIKECAAVAVPSELSEDEILVAVVPVSGKHITPEELLEVLSTRLPHFMIPRYVRVVDEIPKTSSGKIQKNALRNEGIVPGTFDREANRVSRWHAEGGRA